MEGTYSPGKTHLLEVLVELCGGFSHVTYLHTFDGRKLCHHHQLCQPMHITKRQACQRFFNGRPGFSMALVTCFKLSA